MSEAKIALRFDQARDELDKIDRQAYGAKTRIISDLAKDLEKLLPIKTIAEEIAGRLKGKVARTLVYRTLEEKYKNQERSKAQKKLKAARKQKLSPQVDSDSKPLISIAEGGTEEIDNGHGLGSNEPDSATAQWQKLKQDKEQYETETNDYIKNLKDHIKELETPFDAKVNLDVLGHRTTATVHVRPARKEVTEVIIDESKLPAGLFA